MAVADWYSSVTSVAQGEVIDLSTGAGYSLLNADVSFGDHRVRERSQ